MAKIFIDAGHGGNDPGAVGNGLREKDLTLAIAKGIRDTLISEFEGAHVKLSREDDRTLSLKQRTDMANAWGADFLLSVHINAGGGVGYEDYIYPRAGSHTASCQRKIHEEVMAKVGFKDRGMKRANFHMLRESRMPAVLTECGFIDNTSDAARLKDSAYIARLARGHALGLVRIFGLKKRAASVQTTYYTVRAGDTLSKIARAYNTSVDGLLRLNPQISNKNVINVGQRLRVK